ncbi:MAG: DUF839 domain-containing protein [Polaromonas sp.]|nr:DUF839 domain-containing protein [Polaromonas sp.]
MSLDNPLFLSHAHQLDPDDLENNPSQSPTLHDVLGARLHRRHVLKSGVGAMTLAGLGGLALSGAAHATGDPAGSSDAAALAARRDRDGLKLGFKPVNKGLSDRLTVAEGYTATVIYATGDTLDPAVPEYKNDGSDDNFARRAGDHHDGIHFFGLNEKGRPDPDSNERALLVLNHENISGTVIFMHPAGQTNAAASAGARPEAEARKEIEAHGVSIVEIAQTGGKDKKSDDKDKRNGKGRSQDRRQGEFAIVKNSRFNRRITASTAMALAGPAAGSAFMKTLYSPTGMLTRGTINNCGNGYTPWGTYLAAEENWAGYFTRGVDADQRTARQQAALLRNGINNPRSAATATPPSAPQTRNGSNRWASAVSGDAASTEFKRWDITAKAGLPADGTGDFRNAANTFGYIVEIDPFNPDSTPVKRTGLGRRANEGAWPSLAKAGQPLAFYIGCDSRGEYVYKFVSKKKWVPGDARRDDRLAVGAEYMDEGTIYAARFNADGSGSWLKLGLSNPEVAAGVPVSTQNPEGYRFENLPDICVNTRLAADAARATRMDRPEWTAVNPKNGEIYITMTENPDRGNTTGTSNNNFLNPDLDPANPRYWRDTKASSSGGALAVQRGNVNGHIVRIREDADSAGAESFAWDIFLFGAQAEADAGTDNLNWQQNVNLSGLSAVNDLSKPDGCWFSKASGILWIETDDNTYTDVTNAMLLAAVPGRHGDGGPRSVANLADGSPNTTVTTEKIVNTFAGKPMTDVIFRRFLVAPKGAEVTGVAESPDGKVLFVNIQHPGEDTTASQFTTGIYQSNWPGNGAGVAAYGPGGASARPRSATVMITKDDGGVIGL